MKKILLASILTSISLFAIEGKEMTVFKSPTCGCCTAWIDIMKEKGFKVKAIETNNVSLVKQKVGIKPNMASCHTAFVDNYVIEGHVDYSAVKKTLTNKPDIVGLTVPGMPVGSPGMEQGHHKDKYNVMAIQKDGSMSVYEEH